MAQPPFPKIIGVDPGSNISGFGVLEAKAIPAVAPQHYRLIDAGIIRAPKTATHTDKIIAMHKSFTQIFCEYDPNVIVIERAFMGKNAQSAIKLGQIRGAIISAAGNLGCKIAEVTPTEVKRAVTGQGLASKESIQQAILTLFTLPSTSMPFDMTDAIAVGLTHALSQGHLMEIPKRKHPQQSHNQA